MSMDFSQYEENFSGDVVFEITGARKFTTGTGSEGMEISLKGIAPAAGYDMDKYDDPVGLEIKDTFWLPSNSDDKAKAQRKGGKVFRFLVACGFSEGSVDSLEDLKGCEVIGTVMKGDDGAAINFNRYKAIVN
jgi:hypothetical protein